MRYIYHILFVLVLIALVYGRVNMNPRYQTHVDMKDPNLDTVEETFTPSDRPATEPTEIEKPNDTKLFRVGEEVTCIYNGVFSWDNGDEFVKGIAVECKVTQVMDGVEDMSEYGQSKHYQRFEVDCTKDIKAKTGGPGYGLVPDHKLNIKKRWYSTEECYHFVTPK